MGWKEFDRVSQREEFVRLAEADGVNFSRLCERFGISRKTGYKWRERHRACAEEPVVDRSRKPHRSPTQTPAEIEQKVLQIRDAHPAWGGLKIRKRLKVMGEKTLPSPSTIAAVLKRHDRISDAESAKRKPWTRFERERPNELWQVDFKGEFALNNKSYCYPLTLLDDHSRFSLGILACGNQTRQTVQSHFRNVFAIYGLPHAIYVDNGNPWGGSHLMRHTRFTAWLMRHDVEVIHGRPHHPQGRGKLERFHRTLKLEALQDRSLSTLAEAQECFDLWRDVYNLERPHGALDLETPSQRYQISERRFQEKTDPFEYSERYQTRRVNRVGQFRWKGKTYRISEAFQDHPIGLSGTQTDGVWDVSCCRFVVAQIDERTGEIRRHQPRG